MLINVVICRANLELLIVYEKVDEHTGKSDIYTGRDLDFCSYYDVYDRRSLELAAGRSDRCTTLFTTIVD